MVLIKCLKINNNVRFSSFISQNNLKFVVFLVHAYEKCLVVHYHPTPITPLSRWTNNVRNRRKSVVDPDFFNNIIDPPRQWLDRSGMKVYNQAFLHAYISYLIQKVKATDWELCHMGQQLIR
jgi:hypothetical protein